MLAPVRRRLPHSPQHRLDIDRFAACSTHRSCVNRPSRRPSNLALPGASWSGEGSGKRKPSLRLRKVWSREAGHHRGLTFVDLETLSLAEILNALPRTRLEAAIVRGGFPELHANPGIDTVAFYHSYLATYLERDVRSVANVERFLRACALRSANLLNKADLARDVGIAPSTANQCLSVLEASGQVVLLEPWFSNRTKSIVKSPKLYLADTGLLCALLNIHSAAALRQSPAAGAVWETFVFAQLRHRERRAGRVGSLFFWRDRTREVDFVVEKGGRLELVEARWTELPAPADVVNLEFVRRVVGRARVAGGGIVCRAPRGLPLARGRRAVSAAELG